MQFSLILMALLLSVGGPNAPENRLAMFAGTWISTGSIDMGEAQPTPVKGTNVCRWSSEAQVYLVCDGVAFRANRTTPDHQLSVYTYDPASKQYSFVNISGGHVGNPGLTFSGNTWTYSNKFTGSDGRTQYFRVLNIFDSPQRYRFVIQSSSDGTHWKQTGSGAAARQ